MTDMPERIWGERPKSDGTGFWQEQPSSWLLPYVRADLVERAILDAQLRAFERGRLDTPDEIRAAALQIMEWKL